MVAVAPYYMAFLLSSGFTSLGTGGRTQEAEPVQGVHRRLSLCKVLSRSQGDRSQGEPTNNNLNK